MADKALGRSGILFGAAYYPEYQRTADLAHDMGLMTEAGFTIIRVGESVWSTWEPEPGRFELDWLEPVLDSAAEHGIGVILGTPTYAVPMWMARLHPEIAGDVATGQPMRWGSRQEMDFTHPAYLFYTERIIRRIVERYRGHPAVVGYQVDNEPGLRLLYNRGIFERFVDSLRLQYGDVETLNREWGLTYWSHRLCSWSDLWVPDGNAQPQYDLAWRRFQAGLVSEFIGWQAGIVRELARPGQFVTTCVSYDQVGVEDVELTRALDVASGNAYYEMQDSLAHPSTLSRSSEWIVRGAWAVTELADRMFSSKQAPFLVTETNASSIGHSSLNFSPYDGQWRQAAWLLVARGARMVEYWHWNTLPYGTETYWGGVLPHSGIPGRAYAELARLGKEFALAGDAVAAAKPDFDIAMLYDTDSKFALSSQAPFSAPGHYLDPDAYGRIFSAFYRGAFDAGRQVRILRPAQLFPGRGAGLAPADAAREHPVLVVPAFFTAADDDLDWLREYAAEGGHLVIGPRTAYADREGRARSDVQPARLAAAAGVRYDEFANLPEALPVDSDLLAPVDGRALAATDWADALVADGAKVLAQYRHPHFGPWAAVTTTEHRKGRITVVGTVPGQELAAAIARWLAPEPVSGWTDTPESVTVSSADGPGGRVFTVHNWSWEPASVPVPTAVRDLLGDAELAPGEPVQLGPWDVRILTSTTTPDGGTIQ